MRYEDWQVKFWQEILAQRAEPFVWGTRDCVLSAARVADAISDFGYLARAKNQFQWTDARSALEILNGTTLQALVASVLAEPVRWQNLNMGDMVLIVDDDSRESLAVHDGAQIIGPDEIGWKVIPFRYATVGWRVD